MALFEVLAVASLTLGLAIPVFIEKVMRSKYEERFDDYRKASRKGFETKMEEVLKRIKESKNPASNENKAVMESLFGKWNDFRNNYDKLDTLLKRRKYYLCSWMVSFVLSILSTIYPDYPLPLNYTLGQGELIFFFSLLTLSVWYIVQQFQLDEKLSKAKKREGAGIR